MTFDERLPSDLRQEEEPSKEQQEQPEEEVIPLQRCPHLYIKYTPEKGKVVFVSPQNRRLPPLGTTATTKKKI
jgi:hypothetical protein